MDTTETIIMLILAAALATFLILAVVAIIQVLKLIKTINRVTDKAEHLIENAANVGDIFKSAAGPISALRVLQNIISTVNKIKRGK
jgi:hypothetical protein